VLCERWELAGALRYDYEGKDADIRRTFEQSGFIVPISSVRAGEHFDEWLPRASLSYRFSRAITSYVLAARGFKAGGFNLTAPAGAVAFGPETSWTYEAGIKTAWLEDRLQIDAAVFHIDWKDMQLSQFDATTGGFVTNAGDATSQGVEVEATGKPCEELALFAGGGLLDTEFDRFVDQFGTDVSGRDLPFAPDATANTGAQWSHEVRRDLTLFARAEAFWVGRFFYDAGNRESERYELVNFRLGCAGRRWRLEGWIRNAFEENWVPVALQANPADPTFFVGESAAPRTFGVTLRVTF
jgi:iron complex outermembrane receptor protein